jgi:DNA repair protein RecO (recombination protein O)
MPIGDYDKRLVILTKELGKITAFVKGARKPNSAFLACSQPFSFGEFQLYVGRTSYNVISVNISNYFDELRKDLEAAYYGLYFCELADYFTRENDDGSQILKLLYQTLRALSQTSIERRLIRLIYELKILVFNGEAPQVSRCVKCGADEETFYFSSEAGGIVCQDCYKKFSDCIKINTSTIYTLQYIITSNIQKLFTFTVSKEVMAELQQCVDKYGRMYIDKGMKSLDLLEKLF